MIDVTCPECRAAPGTLCRRPSEHPLPEKIHYARDVAAMEAGALLKCVSPYDAEAHVRATLDSRKAHGFADVQPTFVPGRGPKSRSDRYLPQRGMYASEARRRARARKAPPDEAPPVVAHVPTWMVNAFFGGQTGALVKEGLVVDEGGPKDWEHVPGSKEVRPVTKRTVTLDSFA